MAAGDGAASAYGGELTFSVIITCLVAASGGLIFGYDIGISGGVSQMKPFLETFFPKVLRRMADAKRSQYCMFDSHALTAFTSSLYIAGLVASLFAGRVTRSLGRRGVMLVGGALFFAGGIMTGAAVNLAMLIVGRMLLGFGVGFTNQATPLYLAEMAPAQWRGSLGVAFQFFLSLGILIANLVNYGTARVQWGWRVSLGLAGAPAVVMVVGAFFLTDTPSSYVMRGKADLARAALVRVRGRGGDVDAELKDITRAVEAARSSQKGGFRKLIGSREYRPHLTFALALPLCHQLSGMMVLTFFSPLVFRIAGFGSNAALMGAVILAGVKFVSLILSTLVIDRYGRKVLVIAGAAIMIVCQVANAWIMRAQGGKNGEVPLPRPYGLALLVLTCVQGAGFGMSWAPLIWVIPGEIFPMEIRSAGQSVSVSVVLGLTFLQTQTFLALLCAFKYATFVYYASWVAVMTAFVLVFLPETKGVPLESMGSVWEGHWYWRRFVGGDGHRVKASPSDE
ncbi:sugar transport protein MST1 [Brachypodium distachyon]|uniref:Major facilitator superfamily (MFS) profile domain-containing protein n=1 Tax=Brachypodium distachyon TaxID=15368 RepID=I1IYD0_BRADI|nr:sugar transport protein MST1 [Brachypodium distachyon]KQJ82915.1 hypothetical protein BRADI_5g12020v3 [Brachypodium distachyon]|eukprot:XP_003581298.1 sugar transport protein MST1 [Brachypodium distachyon]